MYLPPWCDRAASFARCRSLTLGLVLLVIGCVNGPSTDYGSVDLSQVSGTVTLDGQPLPNATVRFFAEDGLTFSHGVTDASGQYTLQFDSEQAGTQKGKKTVRITSGGAEEEEGAENPAAVAKGESIPAIYNSQSTLTADVTDATHEFNFDLKSKP